MVELSNLVSYAFQRVILGAFRSPGQVGLYEGPLRAHNLLYALGGALAVPTVPTASRYVAEGDERRLRELVLRGSRYTLVLFVPVCVALMALAEPLLRAWLGDRYGDGATALTILVSYWLLYGALVVTPGFLVGAGKAREAALVMSSAGGAQHRAVADPDPGARPRGTGGGHRGGVRARLPVPAAARAGRRQGPPRRAGPRGLAARLLARRWCWPARWWRCAWRPSPRGWRRSRAAGVLGVAGYWLAYYALWLDPGERALVRGLLRRG